MSNDKSPKNTGKPTKGPATNSAEGIVKMKPVIGGKKDTSEKKNK